MVTLNAHFDGKVIVPDEPLNLPANQKLRIQVEPIEPATTRTDFREWIGLARNGNDRPHDPRDEDALWESASPPAGDEGPKR